MALFHRTAGPGHHLFLAGSAADNTLERSGADRAAVGAFRLHPGNRAQPRAVPGGSLHGVAPGPGHRPGAAGLRAGDVPHSRCGTGDTGADHFRDETAGSYPHAAACLFRRPCGCGAAALRHPPEPLSTGVGRIRPRRRPALLRASWALSASRSAFGHPRGGNGTPPRAQTPAKRIGAALRALFPPGRRGGPGAAASRHRSAAASLRLDRR